MTRRGRVYAPNGINNPSNDGKTHQSLTDAIDRSIGNHLCDHREEGEANAESTSDVDAGAFVFHATRDIAVGEELTLSYGLPIADC